MLLFNFVSKGAYRAAHLLANSTLFGLIVFQHLYAPVFNIIISFFNQKKKSILFISLRYANIVKLIIFFLFSLWERFEFMHQQTLHHSHWPMADEAFCFSKACSNYWLNGCRCVEHFLNNDHLHNNAEHYNLGYLCMRNVFFASGGAIIGPLWQLLDECSPFHAHFNLWSHVRPTFILEHSSPLNKILKKIMSVESRARMIW